MKCGLLPASQEAAIIGDISYHDYKGVLVDPEERKLIGSNLGPFNKVNYFIYVCIYSTLNIKYLGFGFKKSRCSDMW